MVYIYIYIFFFTISCGEEWASQVMLVLKNPPAHAGDTRYAETWF